MKGILAILISLLVINYMQAQEYPLEDVLVIHLLKFNTERHAEKIAGLLWQVGVDVEVMEGWADDVKSYYIELQDISILDIEVLNDKGKWVRVFPYNIKKYLTIIQLGT